MVINNKIIEQVNTFNYLGNLVSYEKEKDIDNRITKCLQKTGIIIIILIIINNTFNSNKVQKGTRIKLYATLALPLLLYGSETWTLKSKDKSRLTAAEMRFMRNTAKYTWRDHKTNEKVLKELNVTSILEKITSYKSDWIQNINRMPRSKLPNLLTEYAPRGIRNQGRPLKRLLEE
jgi:hypothetical protein